jgi:hypothetical protein
MGNRKKLFDNQKKINLCVIAAVDVDRCDDADNYVMMKWLGVVVGVVAMTDA